MHDLKPGQRSSYGELKNAWRNFQDFRLDGHFCDVTLRTDDPNGRLFRAHRAVLCAVSNYFHALFLGCWRNTDKNVIELPGITDERLDILLGTYPLPFDLYIDYCIQNMHTTEK